MGLTLGPGLDLRICSLNVWNESCPQFWRKTSWRKDYKYYQTLLGKKKLTLKFFPLSSPTHKPTQQFRLLFLLLKKRRKRWKRKRRREGKDIRRGRGCGGGRRPSNVQVGYQQFSWVGALSFDFSLWQVPVFEVNLSRNLIFQRKERKHQVAEFWHFVDIELFVWYDHVGKSPKDTDPRAYLIWSHSPKRYFLKLSES